ncbi:MAG: class I SAM-dependent methyltransferase [Chitinophagales bacterium]|nr:class I SAM-dependent methyltransferase [Chitinophagales bacterium]
MLQIRKRFHLFEFEDLPWFPDVVREGMTDFLRFMITKTNFYEPVMPIIAATLKKTGENQLMELGAGGGGGALKMQKQLQQLGLVPEIILSDLYPNIPAYRDLKNISKGRINYIEEPVNALNVPEDLKGMRLLFSSFHHFNQEDAKKILLDARTKNAPIGIFDAGTKSVLTILFGVILLQPLIFFFVTPFIRPFKWSRLLFTYILPLIPLCTLWDGSVSVLRFYTVEQLNDLIKNMDDSGYFYETGQVKNRIGIKVNYLVGYPLG